MVERLEYGIRLLVQPIHTSDNINKENVIFWEDPQSQWAVGYRPYGSETTATKLPIADAKLNKIKDFQLHHDESLEFPIK